MSVDDASTTRSLFDLNSSTILSEGVSSRGNKSMIERITPTHQGLLRNKQDYLFYEMFAAYTKKSVERENQGRI